MRTHGSEGNETPYGRAWAARRDGSWNEAGKAKEERGEDEGREREKEKIEVEVPGGQMQLRPSVSAGWGVTRCERSLLCPSLLPCIREKNPLWHGNHSQIHVSLCTATEEAGSPQPPAGAISMDNG